MGNVLLAVSYARCRLSVAEGRSYKRVVLLLLLPLYIDVVVVVGPAVASIYTAAYQKWQQSRTAANHNTKPKRRLPYWADGEFDQYYIQMDYIQKYSPVASIASICVFRFLCGRRFEWWPDETRQSTTHKKKQERIYIYLFTTWKKRRRKLTGLINQRRKHSGTGVGGMACRPSSPESVAINRTWSSFPQHIFPGCFSPLRYIRVQRGDATGGLSELLPKIGRRAVGIKISRDDRTWSRWPRTWQIQPASLFILFFLFSSCGRRHSSRTGAKKGRKPTGNGGAERRRTSFSNASDE